MSRRLSLLLSRLKQHSPNRPVWLATGFLYRGDDQRRMAKLARIAAGNSILLLANNDILYHHPWRRMLQDVVTCIREHVTLDEAGRRLYAQCRTSSEIARGNVTAVSRIIRTRSCRRKNFWSAAHFSLDEMQHDYPHETRRLRHAAGRLIALAEAGVKSRFRERHTARHPSNSGPRTSDHRRAWIRAVLSDRPRHRKVRRALPKPILCQGRGSAANSMICLLPRHHRGRSRKRSICCSNASFQQSAASRPISMSISSTTGARR